MDCWEFMQCGRQYGGEKVDELGVCPTAQPGPNDGKNGGKYSGRFCWAVAGTLSSGKSQIQGIFALNLKDCLYCDFLKQVNEEEGENFIL
jgi:hypothetical protein